MIKLIATDMDGTFLNNHHEISQKNLEAVKFARDNNIEFVIATGRAYYEVTKPLDEANLSCEVICYNGGITYDLKGNIIDIEQLDAINATKIINTLKKFNINYQLYTQKCTYTKSLNTDMQAFIDLIESNGIKADKEKILAESLERKEKGYLVEVSNIDDYINIKDNPLIKIIGISSDVNKLKEVAKELNKNNELSVTSSGINNIEIMSKKATKGLALKKLATKKNISLQETVAIGDNLNDLSMIEIVKYSVAMKNANDKLKEKALYIANKTNDESGVGDIVVKLIKEINGEKND